MLWLKITLITLTSIYGLVYIILAFMTKKPIRTILWTALLGVLSLAAVNLSASFTGVGIPINAYTVGLSAAGGVPAAAALILFRTIFGL